MKKLLTNNQNHLNNTMQPTAPTQYQGAKYATNPSPVNQQAAQLTNINNPINIQQHNANINNDRNNNTFMKSPFVNNNHVQVKYNQQEQNKTQGNGFLTNRKNNTFRATTAGQNGRAVTGGQYKTIVQPQHKGNEPLNNTYTTGVKDKNMLIQMINDKKSPRPPTNGYMITRRYKNEMNKTKM